MRTGDIPDESIRASSETEQNPAYHGRIGGSSYWCPRNDKISNLEIHLPKTQTITAAILDVKDGSGIKAVGLKAKISSEWFVFSMDKVAIFGDTLCSFFFNLRSSILGPC